MTDSASVELILFNKLTNRTIVFLGSIDGGGSENTSASSQNASGVSSRDVSSNYDEQGALMYVVAVILVYSLAMSFLVVSLARRNSTRKNQDSEVNRYLKGLERARRQTKEDSVKRMRLRWPGNFIGPRFGGRAAVTSVSEFHMEGYPEWPCLEEDENTRASKSASAEETSSEDSYVLMPATTVAVHDIAGTGSASLVYHGVTHLPDDHDGGEYDDSSAEAINAIKIEFPKGYTPRERVARSKPVLHGLPQSYRYSNHHTVLEEGDRSAHDSDTHDSDVAENGSVEEVQFASSDVDTPVTNFVPARITWETRID